jgi:hypothetical protein
VFLLSLFGNTSNYSRGGDKGRRFGAENATIEGYQRIPNVPDTGQQDTRGHGTTGMAKLWKQQVQELLQTAPRRAM